MEIINDGNCKFCEQEHDIKETNDAKHFFLRCKKYETQRLAWLDWFDNQEIYDIFYKEDI